MSDLEPNEDAPVLEPNEDAPVLEPGWRSTACCAAVVAAVVALWGLAFPSLWPDAGGMPGLGDVVGPLLAIPAIAALALLAIGGLCAAEGSARSAKTFFTLGFCATGLAGMIGMIVLGS